MLEDIKELKKINKKESKELILEENKKLYEKIFLYAPEKVNLKFKFLKFYNKIKKYI